MPARRCRSFGRAKTISATISTVRRPVTSCMPAWTRKANCSPGGTAALRHPSKPFTTALAFHLKPRPRWIRSTFPLSLFQISGSSSLSPNPACPSVTGAPLMPPATSSYSQVSLMKPRMPPAAIHLSFCSPRLALRERSTWEISKASTLAARRGVIELAAEKSGWHKPLTAGRGRGIAAAFGWGSYVAQVAEVTCDAKKAALRVDRVVCAVDCGTAVNPLSVRAQMEGAINFGLAQALKSAITISGGRVEQSNFHDYEVLRMSDAPPVIEVHIVPSAEPPGGCGEPGVPRLPPRLPTPFSRRLENACGGCRSAPPICARLK